MEQETFKRPIFLTVLCILTFIALGFSSLSFLASLFSAAPTAVEIERSQAVFIDAANKLRSDHLMGFADIMEQMGQMTRHMLENANVQKLLTGLTLVAGLFGTLLMWQGKKMGFHLYVGYCILQFAMPYMLVPAEFVPLFIPISNGILSLIFIVMYSVNLKHLK